MNAKKSNDHFHTNYEDVHRRYMAIRRHGGKAKVTKLRINGKLKWRIRIARHAVREIHA